MLGRMNQPAPSSTGQTNNAALKRQVGVAGAVVLGLGSIIGTGVFVSVGLGVGIAGAWVVLAILLAALVALCNGLSSAQLAANHPVSGGTYAYGNRYLNPTLGFVAGWMFLSAKSASAATAALGFAGYLLTALGYTDAQITHTLVAIGVIVLMTGLVLSGIRRSNWGNALLVGLAVAALAVFVVIAFLAEPAAREAAQSVSASSERGSAFDLTAVLHATALMFVAYTGYGRVATLGEEIHEPRKNIPIAVIATLAAVLVIYLAVAIAGVQEHVFGYFSNTDGTAAAAPLEAAVKGLAGPGWGWVITIGAAAALLGVLLNLILGLSRVVLAMGRERDVPGVFAKVNASGTTPVPAVLLVAVILIGLALIGDVKTTWTFSAFTVLIYYALTNLCALRLSSEERFYPRFVSVLGLAACLFLAFWVPWPIWLTGLGVIAAGLVWHRVAVMMRSGKPG